MTIEQAKSELMQIYGMLSPDKQRAIDTLVKMEPCEDCISRKSIKQKLQEHHDFFVNAYGGFSNLPQNDKSRVDEITNCIAMVVNEPPVTPQESKYCDRNICIKNEYNGKSEKIDCNITKCENCVNHNCCDSEADDFLAEVRASTERSRNDRRDF